ncbi:MULTISPECIES: hypothetical protein [unclassified Methylobacterium]|uniref:hypothetical protein n=1 Tax=unclassified Methylobacterium TaxID=2615210 RepID=UPI000B277913|nr:MULTISPECIES: hypothetical protein [unclassified Methylobacterium]
MRDSDRAVNILDHDGTGGSIGAGRVDTGTIILKGVDIGPSHQAAVSSYKARTP